MAYIEYGTGKEIWPPRTSNHGAHGSIHGVAKPEVPSGPAENPYPRWMHRMRKDGVTVSRLVKSADEEKACADAGFAVNA